MQCPAISHSLALFNFSFTLIIEKELCLLLKQPSKVKLCCYYSEKNIIRPRRIVANFLLTPHFPFNPLWIHSSLQSFFHSHGPKQTIQWKVLVRSAITIEAMKHAPGGGKGETEWQQMTRHSQLLNNAWKLFEHEEPTTEGRYADGAGRRKGNRESRSTL